MCLAMMGVTEAAQAQSTDEWQITLAPYLMAAQMDGKAGIGRLEADVDVSAESIFENLQFGFQGYFEAMKGNWGVGADIIWMALGTSTDKPVPANVDVNQGGFTFLALRRLSPAVDLRGGLVVNTIQGKIKFKDPIDRLRENDATWVDPLIGVKFHTPATNKWGFALVADIGGFGMGSDFMFNVMPTLRIGVTEKSGLVLGYRWISLDYENDADDDQRRFMYDVVSSGPFMGFVMRF
jgi:hypothetical protein